MKKKKEINWVRWHWLRQHLKKARKSPLPEEPQAKITNFLTTIFAAIPIITAGIYLSGMAYHFGECMAHGLQMFEFPWPADFTLAWGYMQWLDAGKLYLWPLFYVILGIALTIILLLFWVELRLTWAWWCYRLLSIPLPRVVKKRFHKTARTPAPKLFILFAWLKILYDRAAILVIPALLVLLPASSSLKEGHTAALEQIKMLEQGTLPPSTDKATSPLLGDTPHLRVMCNTTHCAYRLKGGEMKLIRHDQVKLVQWTPEQNIDN